jgi:SAM-dependent methyltransferase
MQRSMMPTTSNPAPETPGASASASTGPAERTTGWRAIFSLAPVYRLAQRLIGADKFRSVLVNDILDLGTSDRVIDIGCGTADIIEHLPRLDYVGFDPSQRYVDDAQARFGDRGTFVTAAAEHFEATGADRTMAMAIGVLHHMSDDSVTELFQLAHSVLESGGRLVTIDPTLVEGQHRIARLLVSRDRGQHVRHPDQLQRLVTPFFPDAEIEIRHDLLRPPYSHAIIRASRL